jgi:ferredoxin
MAEVAEKHAPNVAGWFYTDSQCIDCDVCRETAPDNFERHDDGFNFVKKQPASEEEAELCVEAMAACPVDAIGDNGS